MADPAAWRLPQGTPVDWADITVPQRALDGARVPWPRGKVLGGSSAINAMDHARGAAC
ncbi:GMC family oxidoreductase N-terminal domain-containing protein [Streptomyces sp. NPDC006923]|uniref:GMC family oxidoreductase N-terminal domain-containing protein n=1 Tax=Streptomyces sp. NPDC006923 TaxID=3155355 RepID=UPI0033E62D53